MKVCFVAYGWEVWAITAYADAPDLGDPAKSHDSLRSPFDPACGYYSATRRISLLAENCRVENHVGFSTLFDVGFGACLGV